MDIVFVTGNIKKWEIAKKVFGQYGVRLMQQKIETPEIQSFDVREVSLYSAQYATKILNKPVLKSDVGYYIKSLNGFPGPFVKYVNSWLTSNDILQLMSNKKNREIEIVECLTYHHQSGKSAQFIGKDKGCLALKAESGGSSMDQILIRNKIGRNQSLLSGEEMLDYWSKNLRHYHKMGRYLQELERFD